MKKRGFTLIELLAVIVILAIIALIATPIVMNVIKNTRKGAAERSAENYVKSIETIVMEERLDNKIVDGKYSIQEDGNLCKSGETCTVDTDLNIDMNGDKPRGGSIVIENGKIVETEMLLLMGDYSVKYNEEGTIEAIEGSPISEYLANLYNANSTVEHGVEGSEITYNVDTVNSLIDDGLGGELSSGGNIRYYGAKPANYIDIGDRDSQRKVIPWRIIGLFKDVEVVNADGSRTKEDLVKIIRNDSIGYYSWDYTSSGKYNNNWKKATLNKLLNETYYNAATTTYYNNSSTAENVDLTSKGLSPIARSRSVNVLWNLGGVSSLSSSSKYYKNLYTEDYYDYERGSSTYSTNPDESTARIGLIYPSDYGYATDFSACNKLLANYNTTTCYGNDWLYFNGISQWTTTHYFNNYYEVSGISSGYISQGRSYSTDYAVRPVMYLNYNTILTGGTGVDKNNPYVVK